MLFDHDDYDGAVGQHQAALRIFESIGDHQEEEIVLDALGQDYSRLGQYAEAAKTYQRARCFPCGHEVSNIP
jgi:tetratricopeptide (TPR) repeat protein